MVRNSLIILASLAAFVACSSGSNAGDGGQTNGGNGTATNGSGSATGGMRPTVCTAADDTQGECAWPEFCLSKKCIPPQNVTVDGMDVNSNACATSKATIQGAGNLDLDRQEDDAGIELLMPNSPIITDLQIIPVQSDMDCVKVIGHNTTEYQESAEACLGGNTDPAGTTICAAHEAAVLFQGHVWDPQANFATKEGAALDSQFFWMTSLEAPVNFTDPGDFGASIQSGFVIPGAGWSASGGPFVVAQCLNKANYPAGVNAFPVTLHFCDTSGGTDGGTAGNSYCTDWQPF